MYLDRYDDEAGCQRLRIAVRDAGIVTLFNGVVGAQQGTVALTPSRTHALTHSRT
jgi:hypothetical protein